VPTAGTWGEPAPWPDALAQATLETDPAAKAHLLAVNAMTPLERALASFQHSMSFPGVHQMRRNTPQA
jgi:hypothetical protein